MAVSLPLQERQKYQGGTSYLVNPRFPFTSSILCGDDTETKVEQQNSMNFFCMWYFFYLHLLLFLTLKTPMTQYLHARPSMAPSFIR